MRPATSAPRLGFFSAMPIHSMAGWRAATSPRNSPTRPAPTMASPIPLAFRFIATSSPNLFGHRDLHLLGDLAPSGDFLRQPGLGLLDRVGGNDVEVLLR